MVPLMLSAVRVPVIFLASATPLANNIIAKTNETNTRMGLLITTALLICSGTEEERGRDPRLCFCTPQILQQPDASCTHGPSGLSLGAFTHFHEETHSVKTHLTMFCVPET